MIRRWSCVSILLLGSIFVYWRVGRFEFTNYDDPFYVARNPFVQHGISLQGLAWAFTTWYTGNWIPLTWISHMLGCELVGLNPGGHHLINLLLHGANAIVLLLVLERMTGAFWRSAIVAAVFAWHPLHIESVAWISERKDVL